MSSQKHSSVVAFVFFCFFLRVINQPLILCILFDNNNKEEYIPQKVALQDYFTFLRKMCEPRPVTIIFLFLKKNPICIFLRKYHTITRAIGRIKSYFLFGFLKQWFYQSTFVDLQVQPQI